MNGPAMIDVLRYRIERGCPKCAGAVRLGPGGSPPSGSNHPVRTMDAPCHCTVCGWEMAVVTDSDAMAYAPEDLIV